MYANKFATMLHNNTNKITLILVYAVLEWMLIILLLINSVLSYLIIKFTQYFGLNPPCFSCARIGRIRDHLCELHSKEVSQLKYCLNHRKLEELNNMCEKCSSSDQEFGKGSRSFVFSKVERIDVIQVDVGLKCRCCGLNYERKFGDESTCFVVHPIGHHMEDKLDEEHDIEEHETEVHETGEYVTEEHEDEDLIQFEAGEDLNSHDLEFFTEYNGDHLFPFELPHPKMHEHPTEDEDQEFGDFQEAQISIQHKVGSYENLIDFGDEKLGMDEETPTGSIDTTEEVQEGDSDSHSVHEEDNVSIGTQIPVSDLCDEFIHEENAEDLMNLSVKIKDYDEDKAPDTPSGLHSPNPFHKGWLFPGTEESLEGSVISETDGGDPVSTVEKFRSALKAEQKALRDLYMELEEERNASTVAANETMAMITRLQEEKASMQMEALQYQRMMEEQSEYDQEALQLLNEVMMKKEKELESYRKKVSDYKAKTPSISWSRSEDDEVSSIDLYHVQEDENALCEDHEIHQPHSHSHSHNRTPVNSVLDLESTLANFEDERVSILEHLRVLEEKLVALGDEEDRHYAKVEVIGDHYEEINYIGYSSQVITECTTNGFARNGKQATGKQLFPLFEAVSIEGAEDVTVRNGYESGFHPLKFEDTVVTRFELEKKRIDMEEEIDQVYTRLQALEADREFLKQCIGSMNKGDKGMVILQEILHHLRDLRDVNLRAKSYTDNILL